MADVAFSPKLKPHVPDKNEASLAACSKAIINT